MLCADMENVEPLVQCDRYQPAMQKSLATIVYPLQNGETIFLITVSASHLSMGETYGAAK